MSSKKAKQLKKLAYNDIYPILSNDENTGFYSEDSVINFLVDITIPYFRKVLIDNSVLLEGLKGNGRKYDHYFKIAYSHISKDVDFKTISISNCQIDNCRIIGSTDFSISFFKDDLHIHNTIFLKKVNFIHSIFNGYINFENCHFLGGIDFSFCQFKDSYNEKNQKLKQRSSVIFNNCKFDKTISFKHTYFDGDVDFSDSIFKSPISFYKTIFNGIAYFSNAEFLQNVLFSYTTFKDQLIFRHTKFKAGIDLSLANILGVTNLFKTEIKSQNYKSFKSPNNQEKYKKLVFEELQIPTENKRETFRILKNLLIQQNNRINSNEYYFMEMISYSQELAESNKLNINNRIINFMNLISNFYGKWWLLGIAFTTIFGWAFLSLATIFTDIHYKELCWEHFLQFLNPTHNFDYVKGKNPVKYFYLFDFIGRIFVGYGYYQTIAAFRNYTKK